MAFNRYFGRLLVVVMLGAAMTRTASAADDSIWSGLVLATNEPAAEVKTSPELKKFSDQLKNIFGYNQYELLGQHTEVMNDQDEHWLIPGKDLYLSVNSHKAAKPGYNYRLKLQFFQEQQLLARMDARLSGQNLLFIRGPLCGKGQLVIVLVVR